jgi:cell division protein ZapA
VSERASASTTEVEIFGATYVIRGGQQPEYLNELAGEVDRRMRELAGHVTSPESGRLAILTALNLADELSRSRTSWDGERSEIETRLTSLASRLAEALEEGRSGGRRPRAARKIEERGNP